MHTKQKKKVFSLCRKKVSSRNARRRHVDVGCGDRTSGAGRRERGAGGKTTSVEAGLVVACCLNGARGYAAKTLVMFCGLDYALCIVQYISSDSSHMKSLETWRFC